MELVRRRASATAVARGSTLCGTVDVLFAVLATYGPLLDRALYIRGTSRQEVLEQLEQRQAPVATATATARLTRQHATRRGTS